MDMNQWFTRTMSAVEKIAQSQDVCRFDFCLTKAEWAAWAQAILSALAVFAAIWATWYPKYVEKEQKIVSDKQTATLVAWDVLLMLESVLRFIQVFRSTKSQAVNAMLQAAMLRRLSEAIAQAERPSEAQLIQLLPIPNDCAVVIAKGFGQVKQIKYYLGFILFPEQQVPTESIPAVYDHVQNDTEKVEDVLKNAINLIKVYLGDSLSDYRQQL